MEWKFQHCFCGCVCCGLLYNRLITVHISGCLHLQFLHEELPLCIVLPTSVVESTSPHVSHGAQFNIALPGQWIDYEKSHFCHLKLTDLSIELLCLDMTEKYCLKDKNELL